jgi:hypothetical protein
VLSRDTASPLQRRLLGFAAGRPGGLRTVALRVMARAYNLLPQQWLRHALRCGDGGDDGSRSLQLAWSQACPDLPALDPGATVVSFKKRKRAQ